MPNVMSQEQLLARSVAEAQLQQTVIEAAKMHGWRVAHFRPGMTRRGRWVTPVQADGAGFPDLVLVRQGRLLFVELKAEGKKPTPRQQEWLDALGECTVKVYVWRSSDWVNNTILDTLK